MNSSICPLPFPLQLSSTRNSHQLFNTERSYLNYLTLNFLICKIKIIIEPNVVVFLCTICKSQMLAYNKLWHTMLELYLVFIYLSLLTERNPILGEESGAFWKVLIFKNMLIFLLFFFLRENHILPFLVNRNEKDKVSSTLYYSNNVYHTVAFY